MCVCVCVCAGCTRMCRYQPMWVEYRSPGNKHNCWNSLCYWGHVTRNLCRGSKTTLPNECCGYDIKPADGKAPALEIWGMWGISSLLFVTGPLWPAEVAPDRVLPMGQIEQTVCKHMIDVNCDCYIAIYVCI